MTDPHPDSTATDAPALTPASKPKRHRLFDFTAAYWRSTKPEAPPVASPSSSFADIPPAQPDKLQSSSVSESQVDGHSDLDSHSSSSSESEQGEDENDGNEALSKTDEYKHFPQHQQHLKPTAVQSAQRIQFQCQNTFYILYRATLPDLSTLSSLATRGTWAVIMAGGGHFCATLWDTNGHLIKHKTFHRYTSRRKQGGSQSAADAARGNAKYVLFYLLKGRFSLRYIDLLTFLCFQMI